MKKIYIGVLSLLLVIASVGCRHDLLDLNPYDRVSSGQMWTTENLANQGVTGIYNAMKSSYAGASYTFDAYGVTTTNRDQSEAILFDKATSGNGLFSNYWKSNFEGVHRANDAITNLPKAPLSAEKKARFMAESKVLRAFFYYKLNMVFKGVPLYLEPVDSEDATNGKETEETIWNVVLKDLTEAIDEVNLPIRYKQGDSEYGRVSKAFAHALRGKVYLWIKDYAKAEADFVAVGNAGHDLFQGEYKMLFKEVNEQSEEMVFSIQYLGITGFGNDISFRYGSRVTFGSCWNTYLPSTDFVDTYQFANGKPFNWNDIFPEWDNLALNQRVVFFLRDNLQKDEKKKISELYSDKNTGAAVDFSHYLPQGNEARLIDAYNSRDPRLTATIITPYSEYFGSVAGAANIYTLRWPYRTDGPSAYDVKTDTNTRFYYLYRKFVAEGDSEIPNRSYSPIDFPVIRYADVLLNLAEALNEQGKTDAAVECVNKVRSRAGIAALNSNEYTQVASKEDLRECIRNERRWEFNGEGVNFFDELRWRTLEDSKFFKGAGLKEIWGLMNYEYSWPGDRIYSWPTPLYEIQKNKNLRPQVEGWED